MNFVLIFMIVICKKKKKKEWATGCVYLRLQSNLIFFIIINVNIWISLCIF